MGDIMVKLLFIGIAIITLFVAVIGGAGEHIDKLMKVFYSQTFNYSNPVSAVRSSCKAHNFPSSHLKRRSSLGSRGHS